MRFGAFVPQGWRLDLVGIDVDRQWDTMLGVARAIESAGYESLWVYDHFHTVPVPTQEPTYEAWTLMAALAATTETVRLGQMCTCNGYRNPAYLAKVAASIDAISGGRVEMGIGAGWYEAEFRGYGYDFAKGSVRIGQLAEGVEIMRRLWTEDEVTFQGKYFQLDGGICRPRPVQEPHIPVWIAGGGEQLTLRVAARHASYTNFGTSVESFVHKSKVLAEHCREVGSDFDAIVRTANFILTIGESESDVTERIGEHLARIGPHLEGPDLERARRNALEWAGTPEQLVERLRPWAQAGMAYAICYFNGAAYDTSVIDLFARQVMPAL